VKQRDNASWLSELKGEPVKAPRREKLQDLVDSRPFWDGLADLGDLPEGVEVHEDVALWDRGERTLTAEVYVPDGPGPYPLFLHIHGGGYCVSSARNDRKWGMRVTRSRGRSRTASTRRGGSRGTEPSTRATRRGW
jgi:acetyl esterase/lipase